MEKTMTLNLRVNPTVKQQAEDVLKHKMVVLIICKALQMLQK